MMYKLAHLKHTQFQFDKKYLLSFIHSMNKKIANEESRDGGFEVFCQSFP